MPNDNSGSSATACLATSSAGGLDLSYRLSPTLLKGQRLGEEGLPKLAHPVAGWDLNTGLLPSHHTRVPRGFLR